VRRGIDTNVLVYAHLPAFEEHGAVRRFLLDCLGDGNSQLVLTTGVLHEWMHVVTDARRFEPPVSMDEAAAVARSYLGRNNVEVAPMDAAVMELALTLVERHRLGRKRLADTLFAAALMAHGVHEIITCNPRDFECFEGLHVVDPRR
jgi:predicted nucleic acid-binding protein